MLQKESKIRVLENFYSLDYVFFGKPVQKMKGCCESNVCHIYVLPILVNLNNEPKILFQEEF